MKRLLLASMMPVAALLAVGVAALAVFLARGDDGRPAAPVDQTEERRGSPRLAPESSVCQGILHVPDPGEARTFAAEYTQKREAKGLAIVANGSVDPKALDVAAETVERMFEHNELGRQLADEGAYIVVAEADQGVLDLPEFRCMADNAASQAFFSHVCGVADRADYPVVTVNELDLLGNRGGPCAGLNILYHELGHLVQGWALPPADYFDVRQFYQDALNTGRYKGAYAATNANEYFAEATQAYFLHLEDRREDRQWLQDYDPQIFGLLSRTYGD